MMTARYLRALDRPDQHPHKAALWAATPARICSRDPLVRAALPECVSSPRFAGFFYAGSNGYGPCRA
jgi:hypothetical protein